MVTTIFHIFGLNQSTAVDRFAQQSNAVAPRFNSMLPAPGAEAIDAFSVDWSTEQATP